MPYRWPADTDFALLGTRRPRPELSGLWTHDAHLRSSVSPLPYPGWTGGTGLQAQSLSRSHLPGTRQDQEPRTRNHHRSAPDGDRLGRLLLDRTSTLFTPLVDHPDPIRTPGRLRDHVLGGRDRRLHPALSGHARGTAARPESLRRQYESVDKIILSIDGLQPEKGHETLYVVRELTQKRVWFAEPLISATDAEVRRLIAQGQAVGRILGQAGRALDLGQAGRLRDGDRGRIPGCPASLLREPFPPRRGQARPGGRQSRQGSDAEEGSRPPQDRAGGPRTRARPVGAEPRASTIPRPPSR